MPKLINAYSGDDTLANAFSGLANSFLGNTAQQEVYRQKALGLRRENVNVPLLADAVVGTDPAAVARYGVMAGIDPKTAAGYRQYYTTQKFGPDSREALTGYMSVPGADYGNTIQGVGAKLANQRAIENLRTDRMYQADVQKSDSTPVNVLGDDGAPTIVRKSEAFGRRPVLGHSEMQGVVLAQDIGRMAPEQRAAAGGYAPKNPGNLWVGRTANGALTATADGRTSIQTGEPIVGPVQKIEGPTTEGLSGNDTIDRKILESRVAVETAVADIGRVQDELRKPNAGAAVGYIGSMARGFNNVRAQVEATTRLVGGENASTMFASQEAQQIVSGAIERLFGDAHFNARAQQLGIDSNVLRSQIQDLAYTIAKAHDPGGRISTDDIRRASEVVGATIMDPKAGIEVLENLKGRLVQNQGIRERVTREMFPQLKAPSTAQPPAAPAAIERWERGPDGIPRLVQ